MASPFLTERDVAARLGVSVKTLTRILARVPSTLPGAPLVLRGDGGASGVPRCRRRWNPSTVEAWLDAVARSSAPAPRAIQAPAPRRRPAPAVDQKPERLIDRVRKAQK